MRDTLLNDKRIIERVASLGSFLGLSAQDIATGQRAARDALNKNLPTEYTDMLVSLSRHRQFGVDKKYGRSVRALLEALACSSWRVSNQLGWTMDNMHEAHRTERYLLQPDRQSSFVFLPMRRVALTSSVRTTNQKLRRNECCLGLWNYLCLLIADPDLVENCSLVSVGERIEKSVPGEFNFAPNIKVMSGRIELKQMHIDAEPNPGDQFYLAAIRH